MSLLAKLYSSQSRLSSHCFPVYKHSIISLLESFNIKTSPFYRPPFFGHMQLFPMWFVAYWYFTSLLRKKLEQILAWSHPISYAVISSWQVHIDWECKDWHLCLGDWINARMNLFYCYIYAYLSRVPNVLPSPINRPYTGALKVWHVTAEKTTTRVQITFRKQLHFWRSFFFLSHNSLWVVIFSIVDFFTYN